MSSLRFLDLDALEKQPLATEPFPYAIVPGFIAGAALEAVRREFPRISSVGSFPPDQFRLEANFRAFIDELEGPELCDVVGRKLGCDLAGHPTMITLRGRIKRSQGGIHKDSVSKLVTMLIYFNREWPYEGGRLRLLRSQDRWDDYVAEVPPVAGNMVLFQVCDRSWHGHLPEARERQAIQLNWVRDEGVRRRELRRHRFSARMKRLMSLVRLPQSGSDVE
jgi:SM-20-related protein